MSIETEHRGYTIRYSENEDVWHCYDLKLSNVSLGKLRAEIDAFLLKLRKESALELLFLTNGNVYEAKAIDARPVGWRTAQATPGWDHEIGIMAKFGGRDRPGKTFQPAGKLATPTPETWAAIEKARAADEAARAAQDRAKAAWAEVPRITQDDVAGLLRAATEKVQES